MGLWVEKIEIEFRRLDRLVAQDALQVVDVAAGLEVVDSKAVPQIMPGEGRPRRSLGQFHAEHELLEIARHIAELLAVTVP